MPQRLLQGAGSAIFSPNRGGPGGTKLQLNAGAPARAVAGGGGAAPSQPVQPPAANFGAYAGWHGTCDWGWLLWGENGAASGFTDRTSKAGYGGKMSTQSGDTHVLQKNRGTPYTLGGYVTSATKTGGGRFKGSQSRNGEYHYILGNMRDPLRGLKSAPAMAWQEGETLTGQMDNANTAEVTLMAVLLAYGGFSHRYPTCLEEVLAYSGLGQPKDVRTPQISITSAAAITSGSGAAALGTAAAETSWISSNKQYFILGFLPHLVNNAGLLQVDTAGLPQWWASREPAIPFGRGAHPVLFDSDGWAWPFEAIGPISGLALPNVALYSLAATATTGSLLIGEY